VVLGIGYAMGSTSTPLSVLIYSIGTTTGKGIGIFEEWVREVVVPLYTLSAVAYLAVRWWTAVAAPPNDHRNSAATATATNSNHSKPTLAATVRSSLCSFSLPPVLRKLSTSTIPEEEEDDEPESSPRLEQQQQQQQRDDDDEQEEEEGDKPIDMRGTFKVVKNHNFGDFLKAQGVPWFLCNAASKARPTHHFTHTSSQKITIQIKGIIESQTSYHIDGPFTETTIRGRVFHDTVSYLYDEPRGTKIGTTCTTTTTGDNDNDNDPGDESSSSSSNNNTHERRVCVGVKTRKIAMGEGYEVHVERRIIRAGDTWVPTSETNPNGHCTYDLDVPCDFDRLHMSNKVVYDGEKRDEAPVTASQLFLRID